MEKIKKYFKYSPILIFIYITILAENPYCTAYKNDNLEGVIEQVIFYKYHTSIVLAQHKKSYSYCVVYNGIIGSDALSKYTKEGDLFKRIGDIIEINQNGSITKWRIDTSYWKNACQCWQL